MVQTLVNKSKSRFYLNAKDQLVIRVDDSEIIVTDNNITIDTTLPVKIINNIIPAKNKKPMKH